MTTYRELVYIILDLVRGESDDFTLNENHIVFLLNKYKGYILSQKYAKDLSKIDKSNYQTICIDLELEDSCESSILKGKKKVPNYLGDIDVYAGGDKLEKVETSRLKYAGEGKFGKKMKYFTVLPNRELQIKSKNSQIVYLKKVEVSGVFLDEIPLDMMCKSDNDGNDLNKCSDVLDTQFVIEQGLVVQIIQSVLNDLVQAAYRPTDNMNNGRDDMPDIYSLAQAIARQLNRKTKNEDK